MGLYSIASHVYIAASFVPFSMAQAATPTFNRLLSAKGEVTNLVKKTLFIMTASSLFLMVAIFL